jgi:hypothetical protein
MNDILHSMSLIFLRIIAWFFAQDSICTLASGMVAPPFLSPSAKPPSKDLSGACRIHSISSKFRIFFILFIPVNEQRWAIKLLLKVRKCAYYPVPHFRKVHKSDKLLKSANFLILRVAELIYRPPTLVIK